uniref:Lipocalin n=1 Tax=Rhipicephalus appendiculatus TaxID=34631 RepID=A0A131YHG1_RHIAP
MKTALRNCYVLLYAVLMAVLHFGHCGNTGSSHTEHEEDISEFYSKYDKIETVYSTIPSEACKVDYVNKTTSTRTEFLRKFWWAAKRLQLEGTFLTGSSRHRDIPLSSMDVHEINAPSTSKYHSYERLFYTFDKKRCGVFFVSHQKNRGGNNYELRIKDRGSQHTGCFEKFKWYLCKSGVREYGYCIKTSWKTTKIDCKGIR